MPLDVIMPALGMAQDTGRIVAWHKQPGAAVAKGDILFEVETDKATMEVEAQGDGFLTDVTAHEGADVPVGEVIAQISASAEGTPKSSDEGAQKSSAEGAPKSEAKADGGGTDAAPPGDDDDLPDGKAVIMPTLGMSQDSGLLVKWHKAPGDAVAADDILFEVETDKATNEVNAGHDGFLAATLAAEGEEVPVGQTIAIISAKAPAHPITRKAASAAAKPAPAQVETPQAADPEPAKATAAPAPTPSTGGRILASPKARRLARAQGLDLARLVAAGHPQPFHVKDLDLFKTLPSQTAATGGATPSASRITARIETEGFSDFATWAADHADLSDPCAILAGFCAASAGKPTTVAVDRLGTTTTYAAAAQLGRTEPTEDAAELRLRDLRASAITAVELGAADMPTLTLTRHGGGIAITLEFTQGQMAADDAIALLSDFAGRMEHPLRHLL